MSFHDLSNDPSLCKRTSFAVDELMDMTNLVLGSCYFDGFFSDRWAM